MTNYTGLCVKRLTPGKIFHIQVKDSRGYEQPIEPDDYIERNIKPLIEDLPDCDELKNK